MNPGLYRLDAELSTGQLIAALAATPERVRTLISGRGAEALQRQTSPDEWSAIEVCKHLRDAAQVYGMRFKWMILNDDPLLPNYDEDRWVAESPDGTEEIESLLTEMAAYRAETVRLLTALPSDGWTRTGRHEVLGTLELGPYVRHQVEHERQHLVHLEEALSS